MANVQLTAQNYFDYANVAKSLKELEKIEENKREALTELKETRDELARPLKETQKTWIGYFVKVLKNRTGFLGKIHGLFLRWSKSYKEETEKQNRLNSALEAQKRLIETAQESLANAQEGIKEFKAQHKAIFDTYPQLNNIDNVFKLMIEACGGQERYNALPVLDLSGRVARDYVDYIRPADMTAPIMRFTDPVNRPGIAVRTNYGVQAFFQRYRCEATWVEGGYNAIPMAGGYFIDQGVVKEKPFKAVRTLLTTGRLVLNKNEIYNGSIACDVTLV